MRILELTHRGDELHAICTGILYCFASRVVNMAVEMTQNPVLAWEGMHALLSSARGRATTISDDCEWR